MTELKPCPFCGGAPELDSQQAYRALSSGKVGTRFVIYCTSCNADMGFCREDIESCNQEGAEQEIVTAWNTRVAPRTDGDDGELVDWLKAIAMRQEHDHPFKVIGQAAARITALSAEVERLTEAYNRLGGTALAEVAKWATESGRKDAKIDALLADLQTIRRQALGAKP